MVEKPFWLQAEAAKMNRQYSNLGNVLAKAASQIEQNQNSISDDNDVFWGFIEHSKEISEDEMQKLLAGIIAGEYNSPGTYSKSTLQVVKNLGKTDLEILESLWSLRLDGTGIPELVFKDKAYGNRIGLDFGRFLRTATLGLFSPSAMARTISKEWTGEKVTLKYFGNELNFLPIAQTKTHDFQYPNHFSLSRAGLEIIGHLNPHFNSDYYEWLKGNLVVRYYKLEDVTKPH